ncbi:MAG: TIGR03560 family F420-dependent LLM class oxidoreductase [Chloroflexi bacterium]|nr:TIGR03560 family F420-dependent LLM class oxidoreductase [Chloroflexota bacterium]
MHLGLHLTTFNPAGGNTAIRASVKQVAQFCDENGFYSLSPMDHFFQIGHNGPPEDPMLEAYTTLGYLAAVTEKIKLLTVVTGVVYRHPGILAKTMSTLDVLAGGRTYLGIGAAWNERESAGLGVPFPALSERFERLEETLQIVLQMWSGDVKPYTGKHYQLAEAMNSPQPVSAPHPPILIGGSGEKKTLRMVAQYADACNLFLGDTAVMQHKLDVLKQHCDNLGRDFKEIELTATGSLNPETQSVSEMIAICRAAAQIGITHVMIIVPNTYAMTSLDVLAKDVIPVIEGM